jgi:hypothetical protein
MEYPMPAFNPNISSIDLLDLCDEALKGNLVSRQQLNQAALKGCIEAERLLSHLKEALDNYRHTLPKKLCKNHAKSLEWISEIQTKIKLQQKLSLLLEQALMQANMDAQLEIICLAKEEKNAESMIAHMVKKHYMDLGHAGSAWLLECYLQQFPKCTQQVCTELTDKVIDNAIFKDEAARENLQLLLSQSSIVAKTIANRIHAIYLKSSFENHDRSLTLRSTDGQLWLLALAQQAKMQAHFSQKELTQLRKIAENLEEEKFCISVQVKSLKEQFSDTELAALQDLKSPTYTERSRKFATRITAPSPDRLAARQLSQSTTSKQLAFLSQIPLAVEEKTIDSIEHSPLGISAR